MKTSKQLLIDFYLNILNIPTNDRFRALNPELYNIVRDTLSKEIDTDPEVVETLFKRMVNDN